MKQLDHSTNIHRYRFFALLVILALLCQFIPPAVTAQGPGVCENCQDRLLPDQVVVVRVYYPDLTTGNKILLSFEPQIQETNYEEGYHIMKVKQADIDRLLALNLGLRVERDFTWTEPPVREAVPPEIDSIPGYSCYRTVEETFASAQALATNHPNLATWTDVGDSWEKSVGQPDGYDMMVLKLTNSAITGNKPKLFVTGGIHAREYATPELVTRFGEYLVNNYGIDPDATWILDHHEVHLMLQTNPDGRKEAEAGASWRKNTNENYCGVTSSNRGADLNRNFSFQWDCCGGSSDAPCDLSYHGAAPASEPEIQAVQNYMASIFPDQRGPNLTDPAPLDATGVYIDMHSYGQLVLWPWGFTSTVPPNGAGMQTLGRKWAYFNNHTPQQAIELYVTDGASKDYSYGVFGVPGYTWEVGTAFFQSCSYFTDTLLPANMPALIYAAKVVRTPYMTPAGPDALSLALSANDIPAGTPVTLTASINDTRYNNSNGTEPTQNIAAAEYYIDTPPWGSGAVANSMAASDGSFNAKTENVTASLNTSGLSTGKHLVYVRGKDVNNNWGAFSAIFLNITGPANQVPIADPQSVSTAEETPLDITLTGSDADGDPLTYLVTSYPSHGSLEGTPPAVTYFPAYNYFGADSFTFIVNDGQIDSTPATVSIDVTNVNDAPVAYEQSVSTAQETPVAITLTAADADGDTLTYTIVNPPAHGSLSGTAPDLTYTPEAGYVGPDGFEFKANDGTLDSNIATISLTVTEVNHPPVADDQAVSTPEDTSRLILLTGSDPDGDPLLFSITSQPLHGTLTNGGSTATYWPSLNYNGPDSFTYIANDGKAISAPATVSITVNPVNDPPVANSQSATIEQNTSVGITLSGSDVDGDPLTFNVTSGPSNGSLTGTTPNLTYTPNAGYTGEDSFSFVTNDGQVDSTPVTVSITVSPAGPLTVFNDDFETNKGWTRNPNGTDTASLGLWERANPADTNSSGPKQLGTTTSGSYDLVTGPLAGSSAGAYDLDGGITTIRSPNFTLPGGRKLTLSFNYYLAHGNNSSTADYLRVKVVGATTATVLEELGAANDDDAAWTSFNGSLDSFGGQAVYLLIEAADASGASLVEAAIDDVVIVAEAPNQAPTANPQSVTTAEDTALTIILTGSDPDGNPLTFSVTSAPSQGTLSGTAPNLTYTPSANFNGSDSFTFIVNDGRVDSTPATVSITVTPVNDQPVANSQSVTTQQDTALAITLSGSDVDGDPLTYSIVTSPSHGSLSGTGPSLTYTPASGYTGSDSFTFKVNDGNLDSNPATVSITVNPAGPVTVFSDDFETDKSWTVNPNGTDTATIGQWERGDPQSTDSSGPKQLGTTTSGTYNLVTGPLAGSNAGSYDIDGGVTTIRSPSFTLPAGKTYTLTLRYYLAHGTNSSSADFLRVKIVGATTITALEELGAANDDDAAWATLTYNFSSLAGQTVYLLIEAADASGASLVDAAVDDILISAQ